MKLLKSTQTLAFIMAFLIISGCAVFQVKQEEVYEMSFDQTYLMALNALDDMDNWRLSQTDHKMGTITVERLYYLGPESEMTFVVKRLEPFKTKVATHSKRPFPYISEYFNAIDNRAKQRALTYPS